MQRNAKKPRKRNESLEINFYYHGLNNKIFFIVKCYYKIITPICNYFDILEYNLTAAAALSLAFVATVFVAAVVAAVFVAALSAVFVAAAAASTTSRFNITDYACG